MNKVSSRIKIQVIRGYFRERLRWDCLDDIVNVYVMGQEHPYVDAILVGFGFKEYDEDRRRWVEIKISRKLKKFSFRNIKYTYTRLRNQMLARIFGYDL